MKRLTVFFFLMLAAVSLAANQLESPAIQLPPNGPASLKISIKLPDTHKVSPDAPFSVAPTVQGAVFSQAPMAFKGKGKDLPYILRFATAGPGEGKLSLKIAVFICQKAEGGVCQLINQDISVPMTIKEGARADWEIPIPVTPPKI